MLVYLAAARCPCFWCCCWLNNPNDTVEYEVWYVYFRHTLHIYFAQALWQGEVQYNPEDQKYTLSIHVAYSVLLFYLDCFKTGNCLGSLRVNMNRLGQLATGVWLLLNEYRAILMDWIPMLMAMYSRNITHTHTSTFRGFRGAVCIVLVLWIIFILTIEGLRFGVKNICF